MKFWNTGTNNDKFGTRLPTCTINEGFIVTAPALQPEAVAYIWIYIYISIIYTHVCTNMLL